MAENEITARLDVAPSSSKLTAEERAAIDEAVASGMVQTLAPYVPARYRRSPAPVGTDRDPAGKQPRAYELPDRMAVREALEWAFATEKASFDFDEIAATSGGQRQGISMEQLILERSRLGSVSIDTSPGRSEPAEEAQVIASIVRAVLPWHAACFVADLARARTAPDWMPDARPRMEPVEWVYGRGVRRGRTEDASRLGGAGWPHWKRRNRRGAIVEETVLFTPTTWSPSPSVIAHSRRRYLDWWGCLLEVGVALTGVELGRFAVTDDMPAMTPWRGVD